jgi:hypothetical protein
MCLVSLDLGVVMKKHNVFFLTVLCCGVLLSLSSIAVSMQNLLSEDLDLAALRAKKGDVGFDPKLILGDAQDVIKIKILDEQLKTYQELLKKISGKKDEPKKGYIVLLSQEAQKITETMMKVAIWTATIPVVFVVCVTTAGAVLEILARLNAFHGAGEVLWSGASGAFADIIDGATRGWFSKTLGLNKVQGKSVVAMIEHPGQRALPLGVDKNVGFFSSWLAVKNPENATPLTPYLG